MERRMSIMERRRRWGKNVSRSSTKVGKKRPAAQKKTANRRLAPVMQQRLRHFRAGYEENASSPSQIYARYSRRCSVNRVRDHRAKYCRWGASVWSLAMQAACRRAKRNAVAPGARALFNRIVKRKIAVDAAPRTVQDLMEAVEIVWHSRDSVPDELVNRLVQSFSDRCKLVMGAGGHFTSGHERA
jgi:hypothetical protein